MEERKTKCPVVKRRCTGKQGMAYAGITVSFLKNKAVYYAT